MVIPTNPVDSEKVRAPHESNNFWTFTEHTVSVYTVAVDSDGFVYSGGIDETVKKIDPDGNEVWTFTGHTDRVRAVAADNDGFVYSASWDGTVRKIDQDGNEVWTFSGHTNNVWAVAADNDGFVYSASEDDTVKKNKQGFVTPSDGVLLHPSSAFIGTQPIPDTYATPFTAGVCVYTDSSLIEVIYNVE